MGLGLRLLYLIHQKQRQERKSDTPSVTGNYLVRGPPNIEVKYSLVILMNSKHLFQYMSMH